VACGAWRVVHGVGQPQLCPSRRRHPSQRTFLTRDPSDVLRTVIAERVSCSFIYVLHSLLFLSSLLLPVGDRAGTAYHMQGQSVKEIV
jgi:hypothetical protein